LRIEWAEMSMAVLRTIRTFLKGKTS